MNPRGPRHLNFDPTNMADDQDFQYQLRAQEEFKETQRWQQTPSGVTGNTYIDPSDGTVYEWDPQRRGWFPKVLTTMSSNFRSACFVVNRWTRTSLQLTKLRTA